MKSNNLIRRSAAMLLAGLMAVSMSACGGSSASGNDSGDSQASSSGDTHKLSVVLKTTSSEYWSYVIAGIEQAEKDLGNVEVDVRGANSDTDFDGQLNMVETIVNADMCEAIAIAPLQADQIDLAFLISALHVQSLVRPQSLLRTRRNDDMLCACRFGVLCHAFAAAQMVRAEHQLRCGRQHVFL